MVTQPFMALSDLLAVYLVASACAAEVLCLWVCLLLLDCAFLGGSDCLTHLCSPRTELGACARTH